jgi:hypothetical protein
VLPTPSDSHWPRNEIDNFVLARLDAAVLAPAAPEDPSALLRRVALDLTGLPPAADDVVAFARAPSDAAYEAYVDRLLAQPAFGEHRARYWLDAARYADTHGYHRDNYRSIWPYRDYVIRAFTQGMPFDQFTIEQLAGDLLPNAGVQERVATGFIRNAMSTSEGGVTEAEYAAIYAKERVETLSAVWLGLTVGCAACHDHKFDPISQRDFYALAAFFRNSKQPVLDENLAAAPPVVMLPDAMTETLVTEELKGEAFANILARGRYDAPGERVVANVPAALPPLPSGVPANRLGLARWLVAPEHPLVARVTVNRFWSEVFGTGIVRTAHDFGATGEVPSHPELLDWLAVDFRNSGWNVKHLFRLMVTSATYRQSTHASAEKLMLDPDNRLLSRGPRFRMDAEMIRDLALAASGLLVPRVGGPSVRPYQPANIWDVVSLPESDTSIYKQDTGESLYRRSLYTFWKRQAPPPAMEIFNAPSREWSVLLRDRTNTPLQALVGMNDVQLVEAARVLAARTLQAETTGSARLQHMSLRILARELSRDEQAVLTLQLATQTELFRSKPGAAAQLAKVGETEAPAELDPVDLAAWTMAASTLLNLDEALTK